ncbi:MAG: putative transcriptional regulatory protein pdtaR [Herbaspirillum frisingense]|uniref:Putative transcriptional regulatory protein pdtaR n=1 Tax=Herbaspirillum frisingense TaxID=92645 RepID=A0A7V8FV41_9BURK|nr:MAG: putative transcriptional regulatory protein pdtaR [Herbaspirillum frisingense]
MTTTTNITVLVVEDDRNAREVYSLVLQLEGYTVVGADHGQHALDLMEKHRVDAIVTDLLMPVMDGLDLATTVKSDSRYAALPIVLLSGRDLKEEFRDIEVFSALLKKPCSAEDLASAVATVLEKASR